MRIGLSKHLIIIALAVVFSAPALALTCRDNFTSEPVKSALGVPDKADKNSKDVTVAGRPNIVDLGKVFSKLDEAVFIGVETWGHAFLQVGRVRLDGHVLKNIEVKEDALTMRHGFIAEIKDVNRTQVVALQKAIRIKNGKMAVSCVNETLGLIRKHLGIDISGQQKDFIWLTDLSEALLNSPHARFRVQTTKDLDAPVFIEKLRKQELTWRNQILTALAGEPAIQRLLSGSKLDRTEANRVVRERYQLSEKQTDFLINEFFDKVESGEHGLSRRDSLVSEVKVDETFLNRFALEQLRSDSQRAHEQISIQLKEISLEPRIQAKIDIKTKHLRRSILDISPELVNLELQAMELTEVRSVGIRVLRDFYPHAALRMFANPDKISMANSIANFIREIQVTEKSVRPLVSNVTTNTGKIEVVDFIATASRIGIRGESVKNSVEGYLQSSPSTSNSSKKWIESWAQWHVRNHTPARLQLRAEMFAGHNIKPVIEDRSAVTDVLPHAQRYLRDRAHTLKVDAYVGRHMTSETLSWLETAPSPIRIYGSSRREALLDLFELGFTDIAELPRNKFTDFDQLIARRPDTGEVTFVIRTLSGRTPVSEAVSHFLYLTREDGSSRIDRSRIKVVRSQQSPASAIQKVLEMNSVKPDVVVIGYTIAASNALIALGAREAKSIVHEELRARVFDFDGKEILVSVIEPHLFGDRAAALVHAAAAQSGSPPTVVFAGTAGSLTPKLKLNEVLVPTEINLANGLSPQKANSVLNFAAEALHGVVDPGLHTNQKWRHGSVDSILFEDQQWFGHYRNRLDVVEQELFDVAQASSKVGARFNAVLRVSDELHSGLDFSANEIHRRNRPGADIQNILRVILERELLTPANDSFKKAG